MHHAGGGRLLRHEVDSPRRPPGLAVRRPGGGARTDQAAAEHPPLRWVADALRPRDGREGHVLVADDAHLLDRASAALLLHLAQDGGTRLIVTVRLGAAAPDAVTALWKDDRLARLDLGPLTQAEFTKFSRGRWAVTSRR
ncbi:hypothetical protein [Actinomadura alba]|uniref:Uncharacterized protein n=1 Tax=Actinomadura alba TaxID=406431 RepID=A0ABR7LWM6_9ACTN|nr:hypothetical protein [Actinomadura alba]MBC6468912.1 hypothetical protein [Actinomadura alba]